MIMVLLLVGSRIHLREDMGKLTLPHPVFIICPQNIHEMGCFSPFFFVGRRVFSSLLAYPTLDCISGYKAQT